MKKKFQKISMAVAAIVLFLGVMLLNVEKNEQGQWGVGTVNTFAQGGESSDQPIWNRKDEDCVYTFTGKAGAKISIFGGTIITIGADGSATYTIKDGKTTCSSGGNEQCMSRYCDNLW